MSRGNQRLPAHNRATLAPVAPPGKKSAKSAEEWLLNGSGPSESADPGANGDFEPESAPAAGAPSTEPVGDETAQWIVDPAGKLTAVEQPAPAEKAAPTERKGEEKTDGEATASPATEKENRDLAKRIRDLQTQLRIQEKDAKTELTAALKERDADFKGQMKAAEKAFEARQAKADLVESRHREERLTKTSRSGSRARAKQSRGREEGSREAGSPSQAAEGGRKATRPPGTARSTGALDLNEASFEELRNLSLSVTQSARLIAYRDVRGGFESLDELDEIPGLSSETRSDLRKRLTLSS